MLLKGLLSFIFLCSGLSTFLDVTCKFRLEAVVKAPFAVLRLVGVSESPVKVSKMIENNLFKLTVCLDSICLRKVDISKMVQA